MDTPADIGVILGHRLMLYGSNRVYGVPLLVLVLRTCLGRFRSIYLFPVLWDFVLGYFGVWSYRFVYVFSPISVYSIPPTFARHCVISISLQLWLWLTQPKKGYLVWDLFPGMSKGSTAESKEAEYFPIWGSLKLKLLSYKRLTWLPQITID